MAKIIEFLTNAINFTNDALYTYILIILLAIGGIYFTVRTKATQVTSIPEQLRVVTEKPSDKKAVSSLNALMVSTASRVGTGNIIGVSAALCFGGFGSVFWMWVIALIGGASAFVESTLAQIYKKKGPNCSYGGPAYYIEATLKCRWLAVIFSIFLILTYGVGFNMLASFNLQSTFKEFNFYNASVTPWVIGGIISVLVGFCLFGGGKRIIKVTGFMVPVMGIAYILVALIVMCINITTIPSVIARIFTEAFDFTSIFGGFTGSCIMYGIKRGLFSNEAGIGSAPNASAAADVKHPVKQGLVQILSVFIDTLVICTATAFMCMCSGVEPFTTGDSPANDYILAVMRATLGGFGPIFLAIAMMLFAFTTLLGNLFYVNQSITHILKKPATKNFNAVYYVLASLLVFVGAGLSSDMLWGIADITMGLMALINIPVILYLSKYAFRALKDYKDQKKQGLDPVFIAKKIGVKEETDYWKENN
ncbi:MAG: alanine:cation symporter family protein [Clostridia bacterium]|nr:alanine:cation symporter family protein [Clostridia bacterium]